jgi:large subunit ribosomal protein L23
MNPYSVIQAPVISEKATDQNTGFNKVTFRVDPRATKQQIKSAVEKIYPKVKVTGVCTLNVAGKKKRLRNQQGYTAGWKKAVVQLAEGSKVEFQ